MAVNKDNVAEINELKAQIKNKKPARVYLFHGSETFLIDFYIAEIKRIVLQDDHDGLNLTTFENKVKVGDIIDSCDTFPVFAERKLVMVKNSSLFINNKKKENAKDPDAEPESIDVSEKAEGSRRGNNAQDTIKEYISNIPDTTCLVFVENQVDKRLGAYKQLAKNGLVLEFNHLTERELVPWVAKGFKTMGKVITQEALEHLVTISEPDMYRLKNEIMKLDAYAGERKQITLDDVKLMATPTIKSVIFDLLDAVAQRNAARALSLLKDMLEIREPEQKILSMLSKQAGEILKLKYLLKKGSSQSDIVRYFQGKHPYALKVMTSQAQRMDENYLKEFLKNCMEAEIGYKSGNINSQLALEILLSKVNS